MSLITETNQQYYQGAQGFRGDGSEVNFTTTFDTDLVFGSYDPNEVDYTCLLYTSPSPRDGLLSRMPSSA